MSAPYQGLGPTLAECLTAEKNALTKELAQVKADHDAAHEIKDAWIAEAKEAEAERDTALRERDEAWRDRLALLAALDVATENECEAIRHLEAVLSHNFAFERGHDFPQEAAARAFLSSMRGRDE